MLVNTNHHSLARIVPFPVICLFGCDNTLSVALLLCIVWCKAGLSEVCFGSEDEEQYDSNFRKQIILNYSGLLCDSTVFLSALLDRPIVSCFRLTQGTYFESCST